jgi:hypothetical protein
VDDRVVWHSGWLYSKSSLFKAGFDWVQPSDGVPLKDDHHIVSPDFFRHLILEGNIHADCLRVNLG